MKKLVGWLILVGMITCENVMGSYNNETTPLVQGVSVIQDGQEKGYTFYNPSSAQNLNGSIGAAPVALKIERDKNFCCCDAINRFCTKQSEVGCCDDREGCCNKKVRKRCYEICLITAAMSATGFSHH